jgi:hypothetical protein
MLGLLVLQASVYAGFHIHLLVVCARPSGMNILVVDAVPGEIPSL